MRTDENYPRKEQRMVSIFIRDIPREIRDSFKALCVIRGITMKQALDACKAADFATAKQLGYEAP